jgi:glycosyltransferase involved in cell wall biosynthesis
MRIALTHPSCWPYVRRGTERNMDELGRELTLAGHEVTTVSTWPGCSRTEHGEAGKRILLSPFWTPALATGRIEAWHTFLFRSAPTLRSLDVDVVHSFGWIDALAAALVRRRRGYRIVVQMNGAPVPEAHYRRFPPERWMIRHALRSADGVIACSAFVAGLLKGYYGVEAEVIPPGVNMSRFYQGAGPTDGRPTVLSVADFDVRRKGLRPLVAAFAILKRAVPEARLRLSGRLSPVTEREVLSSLPDVVRRDVEVLGLGRPEDVPAQYASASLTVLASMWEPSGTALLESWASGTPVVASAHGGLPEFVAEGVGVLFEPGGDGEEPTDVESLAAAMLAGLELANLPGTRVRCRRHAQQHAWPTTAERIRQSYEALLSSDQTPGSAAPVGPGAGLHGDRSLSPSRSVASRRST